MKKVIPFNSTEREMTRVASPPAAYAAKPLVNDYPAQIEGPEQQLLLLQRLIGCTEREELISRFFRWSRDLSLADGITYLPAGNEMSIELGEKRHHSAQYGLTLDGHALGSLTLCRRERYSENELIIIEQALGSLARCLRAASETSMLRQLVTRDPLTGLGNRSALMEWIKRELSRSRRHDSPLTVMMIDVDHFKEINDQLGHLGGDQVLRAIAAVFQRSTRKSDLLFRYGGDEFTIILPHTDHHGAEEAARQIRMNMADLSTAELGFADPAADIRPGLSIGIAERQAGDDEESLLQRADTHLYHAKARGRDRVCSAV